MHGTTIEKEPDSLKETAIFSRPCVGYKRQAIESTFIRGLYAGNGRARLERWECGVVQRSFTIRRWGQLLLFNANMHFRQPVFSVKDI